VDYSTSQPPTIQKIAHGIEVERWKCNPYGDGEAWRLAVRTTQSAEELCKGHRRATFAVLPVPETMGELALQLPDLPGFACSGVDA